MSLYLSLTHTHTHTHTHTPPTGVKREAVIDRTGRERENGREDIPYLSIIKYL